MSWIKEFWKEFKTDIKDIFSPESISGFLAVLVIILVVTFICLGVLVGLYFLMR